MSSADRKRGSSFSGVSGQGLPAEGHVGGGAWSIDVWSCLPHACMWAQAAWSPTCVRPYTLICFCLHLVMQNMKSALRRLFMRRSHQRFNSEASHDRDVHPMQPNFGR